MKIPVVCLVVLLAVISIQESSAIPHPLHKLHKVAGAGALLLKPKLVVGGALVGKKLVGGALLGKALLKPKLIGAGLVGGALVGKALLLKKPKLVVGGLVAAKLAKKALLVGAGALAAKNLLAHKQPCSTRTSSVVTVIRSQTTEQLPEAIE